MSNYKNSGSQFPFRGGGVSKWSPYIFLLVLGLLAFVLIKWKNSRQLPAEPKKKTENVRRDENRPPSDVRNRDVGFDRRTNLLEYSNHAKCRMKCRKISQEEVKEIMEEGEINYKKSDLQNARCPRYAVEGRTSDDQEVRIVFAQCNNSTTVVTVIDLGRDWQCHCPGDDK